MAGINIADKIRGNEAGPSFSTSSSGSRFALEAGDRVRVILFVVGLASIYFSKAYVENMIQTKEQSYIAQSQNLDAEIAKRSARIKELQSIKEAADRYDQVMAEVQRKLNLAESVSRDRNFLVRAVDFVIQQMPSKVWMKSIMLDMTTEKKLSLEGAALKMQTVSDFMFQLQPGSFFTSWELEETQAQFAPPSNTVTSSKTPSEYKNFKIKAVVSEP